MSWRLPETKTSMTPEGPKGWQSTMLLLCLHWSKGREVNLATRSLDLLALGLHFVGEANENNDYDDGRPSHQRRKERSTLRERSIRHRSGGSWEDARCRRSFYVERRKEGRRRLSVRI
ncbi:hypothetical protein L484_009536 [Morus notabilis]|uniref:Uncharacterized protein n=1 Tax=Morus notabilis TaxID=981085 RepID=W9SA26_9ROSA|nr:hypothetical protein L484_009536 [Morus notabilis]